MKNAIQQLKARMLSKAMTFQDKHLVRIAAASAVAMTAASPAAAQSFNLPALTTFACVVLGWMQGELALIIFMIVVVVTLVVGFFAKMDWTKILSVVVLYGLLQGVGMLFNGFLNGSLGCIP